MTSVKDWSKRIGKSAIWSFEIIEWILRDRLEFFSETGQKQKQAATIFRLLAVILIGFLLVGFVGGLSSRNLIQAANSSIKLPFLFLISGLICLPTCYYYGLLFGSRLKIKQIIAILLTSQAVTATLSLCLTPISLLFLLSGASTQFMVTLNCTGLGLAAVLGVIFLVQGMLVAQQTEPVTQANVFNWLVMLVTGGFQSAFFLCWLLIYGLVAAQTSWALRPFLGIPFNDVGLWDSIKSMFHNPAS